MRRSCGFSCFLLNFRIPCFLIFIFPHLTALRLAELNTFHQMQNLKRDLDSSQLGSRDCYRNASYNHAYLPLDSAWFQNMPDMGKVAWTRDSFSFFFFSFFFAFLLTEIELSSGNIRTNTLTCACCMIIILFVVTVFQACCASTMSHLCVQWRAHRPVLVPGAAVTSGTILHWPPKNHPCREKEKNPSMATKVRSRTLFQYF